MDERNILMNEDDLNIEITDANGARLFDPITLFRAFRRGLRDELLVTENPSICSGAPGILYRTYEAELVLTPDETYRLVMLALTSEEFFTIYAAVGNIYEIYNDFYDSETGEALQPRGRS